MTSLLLDERTTTTDHGDGPLTAIPEHFGRVPIPIPDLYVREPLPVPELDVPTGPVPVPQRRRFPWSVQLSVTGLGLTMLTALFNQHLDPGLWGLPGSISPMWYLGLVFIVVGIGMARRTDGVEIGLGVSALIVAVTATAAVVYDIPHLPWAEKHVGVVSFITHYGQVHSNVDIYQAWPGLFSATAWLAKVGGIRDPLVIARVWPPVIDLLELLAFRCFAGRLLSSSYRAWIAAGMFMLASAFNLDYFSPQAVTLLLALSAYAIVVPKVAHGAATVNRFPLPPWRIALLALLSLAMAVTHQITPYFVVASLVVLVLFGLLRPLWIPLVPLIPAAAWALINYPSWKGYFSLKDLFDLGANVTTPGATIAGEHPDLVLRLSTDALAAGPLIVGVLAVLHLWRHHGRVEMALAVCAASAGTLVLVTDYGQEGLYRTTLFALPWLCVLAVGRGERTLLRGGRRLVPLFAVLTGTFLMANFALDGMNAVRPSQIAVERTFERTSAPGSLIMYIGANDNPVNVTYRYPLVLASEEPPSGDIGRFVDGLVRTGTRYPNFYVVTTKAGVYAGQLFGLYRAGYYGEVTAALKRSPRFRVVYDRGGTVAFQLIPTQH